MATIGGVVYCYYRDARGAAARALRASRISATYHSAASLRGDARDHNPTPRYVFHGATEMQVAKLLDVLAADGAGTEVYTEKE